MSRLARASTPQEHPQPKEIVGAALRTYFRIAKAWRLNVDEARSLLGNPARSTFFRWKGDDIGHVGQDVLERISYVLGIYKALHIIFPVPSQADAWIKKPNTAPLFDGASALDRMLAGQVADLFVVRQYLDAQRGWN